MFARLDQLQAPRSRRGSISVELLLNIPIWFTLIFGMVEFGSVLTRMQQVALASRVGAEAAARIAGLEASSQVPPAVVEAVQRQLAGAGISNAEVILEHNVSGTSVSLASPQTASRPTASPAGLGTFVRVTVLVRWKELTPRLLERIAPGLSSQILGQSTTRRYQRSSREAS
jgi:Flp pilus assembly protein TadG